MLSVQSVAAIKNLVHSPYGSCVEELHWSDKELQKDLFDDPVVFRDVFKERLSGLSYEAVLEWHEKYRTWFQSQQKLSFSLPYGSGKETFDVSGFVNLKRVSVINGCGDGAEISPTVLEAPEVLNNPARWSTTRRCLSQSGIAFLLIMESLAPLSRLTHLSVKMEGINFDRATTYDSYLGEDEPNKIALFKNIKHLDVDLCLWNDHPFRHVGRPDCRLSILPAAPNLEHMTWKTHLHDMDGSGILYSPLPESETVGLLRPQFKLRSELYPKLRRLELHSFHVPTHRLLKCLTTLRSSLQSIVLKKCIFNPSLAGAFLQFRARKVVPAVAIFENSRDHVMQPIPEEPDFLAEHAVTKYLVWLGMKGTLCLHDWDERIEAYAISTRAG
ncbi:hypothetical protein V492_04823 [Pseudogymnoascus sp. VKM F-4246]|nr:hypothetical protein V492_04823 [Pseudogymnoascus sp. VKM F-4246]